MSTNDLEIFIPEGKKIKIADKEFTIIPFVIKTRTVVLRIFADIAKEIFKGEDLQNINDNAMAFKLIQVAGARMTEIYKIVLDQDEKWIERNITIKDEIKIIKAIMEVNDFPFLLKEIQEITKTLAKK